MAPVKKRIARRRTKRDRDLASGVKEEEASETTEGSKARPSKRAKAATLDAPASSETTTGKNVDSSSRSETRTDPSADSENPSAEAKAASQEGPGNQAAQDGAQDGSSKRAAKSTDQRATPKPPKKSWHDRLLQLLDYKKTHGNCLVPTRYKENKQLGKWVHNQREQYKLYLSQKSDKPGEKRKCSMTEARVRQLEEAGFVWSTERAKKQNEDWQARFQQLQEYKNRHGHCMVPHGYSEDPSLYEWVHRQRVQNASIIKSGKDPDAKFRDRMNQLKGIGFSFTKQDDVWKERLEELRKYKEQHGNCEVPTHYSENPVLGRWVVSQRYEYRKRAKGKKGVITPERIALLDELGFNWAVGKERDRVTWKSRFDELVRFQKEKGHLNVSQEANPPLHKWCREQKQRLRQVLKNNGKDTTKRMGPDRVQALQEIGFTETE